MPKLDVLVTVNVEEPTFLSRTDEVVISSAIHQALHSAHRGKTMLFRENDPKIKDFDVKVMASHS